MSADPKYIGPGVWVSWHRKTLLTDTKRKKSEVARSIALDISVFACAKCRNHAKEYVRSHPLLPAVESTDPLSLFKWTVDFHNAVNLRLGKPMINWQKAEKMWSGENICVGDCGMEEEEKKDEKEEKMKSEKEQMIIKNY
jgi:hypothetical protein